MSCRNAVISDWVKTLGFSEVFGFSLGKAVNAIELLLDTYIHLHCSHDVFFDLKAKLTFIKLKFLTQHVTLKLVKRYLYFLNKIFTLYKH